MASGMQMLCASMHQASGGVTLTAEAGRRDRAVILEHGLTLPAVATNAEVLGKVPLFALLDANEQTALAERVEQVELAQGTMIFHAGDPAIRCTCCAPAKSSCSSPT